MPTTLLRLPAVKAKAKLSRSTIYRLMEAGQFPLAVKISVRAVAWVESEIDAWLAARSVTVGPEKATSMNDQQIEAAIQTKGLTAARVTPEQVQAAIAFEDYFTAADCAAGAVSDAMVGRFLSWPLPETVCVDPCAIRPGHPHRSGTNLLNAIEARQMLEHVHAPRPPHDPYRFITFCVLILQNGHRIVGVNTGPVSAANFDPELGRKLARQNAVDQIWPLLGYALRDRLVGEGT